MFILEKENTILAKRAKAGTENKVKTQLELGKLQNEIAQLRRIVNAIPNDLKRQIQHDRIKGERDRS